MFSGRFKRWTFTLGKLMKVDGMRAWREVFETELDSYSFARLRESCGSDRLTLRVLQLNDVSRMLCSDKR